MGREVRRVPEDWTHPKNTKGKFIPLMYKFGEDLTDWEKDFATWKELHPAGTEEQFADYHGRKPEADEYMPDWTDEERTHYQMYENTTEGTPISPVCASPTELARWLADNNASAFGGQTASYEAWLAACNRGVTPSAVLTPNGLISGVAGLRGKNGK